ncbi:hypothetical protein ACVWY2_006447 [Bradyrhizobium sp. JR6.1]
MNLLKRLAGEFSGHGIGAAAGRAIGTLAALVQREANTLAYIDGFWLCFWIAILALFLVALITRAPQGPLSPVPLGFVKNVLRRLGAAAS